MYDVGQIARQLQTDFRLFAPRTRAAAATEPTGNLATPKNLRALLDALSKFTDHIMQQRATLSAWMPDAGIAQWDADMQAWRERLAEYTARADPSTCGDNDRWCTLWDVTAPLLLGYYDGKDSTSARRPIDAVTPFSLANQLAVDDAWRNEQMQLFVDDLKANASALVEKVTPSANTLVWVVGIAIAAYAIGKVIR